MNVIKKSMHWCSENGLFTRLLDKPLSDIDVKDIRNSIKLYVFGSTTNDLLWLAFLTLKKFSKEENNHNISF